MDAYQTLIYIYKTQWRDRISTLPTVMQRILTNLEQSQQFDSTLYQEIESQLGKMFSCRVVPRPDCFSASLEGMDHKLYSLMQGHTRTHTLSHTHIFYSYTRAHT